MAVSGELPESCLLQGTITFDTVDGDAGILLNTDAEGSGGYFLRLSPERQAAQFGRIGGYRDWYVDHMPELDRPLQIRAGEPIHYFVAVDGSAVVAYFNDHVALSARMYGRPRGHHGLFADGVTATFAAQTVRSR